MAAIDPKLVMTMPRGCAPDRTVRIRKKFCTIASYTLPADERSRASIFFIIILCTVDERLIVKVPVGVVGQTVGDNWLMVGIVLCCLPFVPIAALLIAPYFDFLSLASSSNPKLTFATYSRGKELFDFLFSSFWIGLPMVFVYVLLKAGKRRREIQRLRAK